MYYHHHGTYSFQSESTLSTFLNIKELLAQNMPDIWSLSHCKRTRTHNHLVGKQTLNHLVKLTKRLGWVDSTYLHGAFDCMLSSCHVRILECIYTLCFPDCKGTLCTKQTRHLNFKWLQRDSNLQPHSLKRKLNHFANGNNWLTWIVSFYMHCAFDCMLSYCQIQISEWIHTVCFSKCQLTPYSKPKQRWYLKFKRM